MNQQRGVDSQGPDDEEVQIVGEFQGPRVDPVIELPPSNLSVINQVLYILAQVGEYRLELRYKL